MASKINKFCILVFIYFECFLIYQLHCLLDDDFELKDNGDDTDDTLEDSVQSYEESELHSSEKIEEMAQLLQKLNKVSRDVVAESKDKGKKCVWSSWSEWTHCSVTCGRGREVRWRKKVHSSKRSCGPEDADYELEEKMCQLSECNAWDNIIHSKDLRNWRWQWPQIKDLPGYQFYRSATGCNDEKSNKSKSSPTNILLFFTTCILYVFNTHFKYF